MGSRLLWRRSATAVGLYTAVALGIVASIVAARGFSLVEFGLFATVLAATGFFQSLLDLTVEDSLTKYGFRYVVAEDWGRLRRLFRRALELKLAGGGAPRWLCSPSRRCRSGSSGRRSSRFRSRSLPCCRSSRPPRTSPRARFSCGSVRPQGGGAGVYRRLRLIAIIVGVQLGLVETIAGIVIAQAVGTTAVVAVGVAAFRRFPVAPAAALAEDRRGVRSFVLHSSAATGMVSLRNALAPLLLGIAAGPTQVGLFRIAQSPMTGFNAASGPVRLILLTEHTRDWERGRVERVLSGIRRYTLIAFVIGLVVVPLFYWLMPRLIELVFGARYLPATDAARIILIAAAVQLWVGWSKSFPVSIGRPGLRLLTSAIETALLLPLVLVLGLHWGATGAAAAILMSSLAYAVSWAVLYVRIHRDQRPPPRTTEALVRE